jgi:hypothetical protein
LREIFFGEDGQVYPWMDGFGYLRTHSHLSRRGMNSPG